MNIGRPKIIAIVTGFISIAIRIAYLLLITIFDFRTYLNDQLSIFTYYMEANFYLIESTFSFQFLK